MFVIPMSRRSRYAFVLNHGYLVTSARVLCSVQGLLLSNTNVLCYKPDIALKQDAEHRWPFLRHETPASV